MPLQIYNDWDFSSENLLVHWFIYFIQQHKIYFRLVLELNDKHLPYSFYTLVHVDDAICVAEAHKEGYCILIILRRNYQVIAIKPSHFHCQKIDFFNSTVRFLVWLETTELNKNKNLAPASLVGESADGTPHQQPYFTFNALSPIAKADKYHSLCDLFIKSKDCKWVKNIMCNLVAL